MDPTDLRADAAGTTVLLCARGRDADALRGRLRRLVRLCVEERHDLLAVGWGPVEAAEDTLRALAAESPHLRILLHARRESPTAALRAGVAAARTRWILLPGPADPLVSLPAARPGPGVDCVPLGAGSVLITREAFARLPPIPGMARALPELCARAGLRVVPAAGVDGLPWWRRVRVALACTMAGIAALAASRA